MRSLVPLVVLAAALVVAVACGSSQPPLATRPAPAPLPDAGVTLVAGDGGGDVVDAPGGLDAAVAAAAFVPAACSSTTVTFAEDVAPIITHGCSSLEGCHGLGVRTPAGAYTFLAGAKSRECDDGRLLAAPGDPQHSYVIDKLVDRNLCQGDPMPKVLRGRPWHQLPQAEVQAIYDWICAGARND